MPRDVLMSFVPKLLAQRLGHRPEPHSGQSKAVTGFWNPKGHMARISSPASEHREDTVQCLRGPLRAVLTISSIIGVGLGDYQPQHQGSVMFDV